MLISNTNAGLPAGKSNRIYVGEKWESGKEEE